MQPSPPPTVRYTMFRGTMASWDDLFTQAAAFAATLPRERLISISHSEDQHDGVVVVWYWDEADQGAQAGDDRTRGYR